MFLVVNEPEGQEISLKNSKFQQILGSRWRLHGISLRVFSLVLIVGQPKKLET
jgi:hypothetical protein